MGGGIGVPPILEAGKTDAVLRKNRSLWDTAMRRLFLKEEFEAAGELYISTEDGSVGTKGNVMDAIREQELKADIIYACGPTPMLRAIKALCRGKRYRMLHFHWKSAWHAVSVPAWPVSANQKKKMHTAT